MLSEEAESGCFFTSENVGFGEFCMFVCKVFVGRDVIVK